MAKKRTKQIDLDALMTTPECASWMRMSVWSLLDNVRRGKIPVVSINEKKLLFHPRTILAEKGVKV